MGNWVEVAEESEFAGNDRKLVDLGGTLHRGQLLPLGGGGKTIGVKPGLQLAVGVCQLAGIELEALCQPEQLEMIHSVSSDSKASALLTIHLERQSRQQAAGFID